MFQRVITSALLALIMMFGLLGPASAATDDLVFTLDGVTYTVDASNPNDVKVTTTETPGAPDKLPAGLTQSEFNSINKEMSQPTYSTGPDGAPAAAPNGCSFFPDKWGKANFKPTCDKHDICYSSTSRTNRYDCDKAFHSRLLTVCAVTYPIGSAKGKACAVVATDYYAAVRSLGWARYKGKGKNN